MMNRIYTNEKTCPLCHKNKAMFTLSMITKETLQNACYDAYKNGTGVRGVHQELEMILSKALFVDGQKIEV